MMALADVALYVAILGEIGIVPLTVTTSLNINFLRRPKPSHEIRAQSRLLKLGKSLVVGKSLFTQDLTQIQSPMPRRPIPYRHNPELTLCA